MGQGGVSGWLDGSSTAWHLLAVVLLPQAGNLPAQDAHNVQAQILEPCRLVLNLLHPLHGGGHGSTPWAQHNQGGEPQGCHNKPSMQYHVHRSTAAATAVSGLRLAHHAGVMLLYMQGVGSPSRKSSGAYQPIPKPSPLRLPNPRWLGREGSCSLSRASYDCLIMDRSGPACCTNSSDADSWHEPPERLNPSTPPWKARDHCCCRASCTASNCNCIAPVPAAT